MITWIDAKETPTQWAATQSFLRAGTKLEGRYKVKLQDGREIYTWWQDDQWSCERLKPNLKVAYWVMPVWRA
jgi:hypothetical protein